MSGHAGRRGGWAGNRFSAGTVLVGAVLVGTGLALWTAAPAAAHSTLVTSEPAAGALLDSAPGRVRLVFDGALAPRYGAVAVTGADGAAHQSGRLSVAGTVVTQPVGPLPPGRYRVAYRLTSAGDDHPVVGALHFDVGGGAAPAAEAPVGTALGPGLALLGVGVVATGAGWLGLRRDARRERCAGGVGAAGTEGPGPAGPRALS